MFVGYFWLDIIFFFFFLNLRPKGHPANGGRSDGTTDLVFRIEKKCLLSLMMLLRKQVTRAPLDKTAF